MKVIFLSPIVLLLFACGGNSSTEKCTYGQPVAIFDESLVQVVTHEFEAKGQNAQEQVVFQNGMNLEVIQDGCHSILQEFRFTLPIESKQQSEAECRDLAAKHFHFLADLGDQYQQYHQYGRAIEELGAELRLAQAASLGQGLSIKLDRISGGGQSTIIVELKQ